MASPGYSSGMKKNESLNYAIEHGAHGLHKSISYVSTQSMLLLLLVVVVDDDVVFNSNLQKFGKRNIQEER